MKTFTVLLFALMATATTRAQHLINQKDAFTGKQIKSASIMLGGTFTTIGQIIAFGENESKTYISLCWMPGINGLNVGNLSFNDIDIKNCSLLLKMDDDSVFKFKADMALSKISGTGPTALINVGGVISAEQLKFLTAHKISLIRLAVTIDDAGINAPVFTDKNKKEVQKAAAFMLNTKTY